MATMQAIRLTGPCSTKELVPTTVEKPTIKPGYVLIKVKAFGVNESEITSRKGGSSSDFSYPRILGIEGAGEVAEVGGDSPFHVGQKVVTMMGGLRRGIDGSYAEYTLVREDSVIPVNVDAPWDLIGSLPEMLQTAYGSLTEGLAIQAGDILFIRGGSSAVGLMGIIVGRLLDARVIATTRQEQKLAPLKDYGAECAVLDDDELPEKMAAIAPCGVDKVLELVGCSTLFQDLGFMRQGGYACFTGALGGQWTVPDFSPFSIPKGCYLTSYEGAANDLPASFFNFVLGKAAAGDIKIPIAQVYHGLSEVGKAQGNIESGKFIGKHVVVLDD